MDPAYHNQMLLFVGAFVVGLTLPPKWILWLVTAIDIAIVGYGLVRFISNPKDGVFEVLVLVTALPIVGAQITVGGGFGMLLRWLASKLLNLTRLKSSSEAASAALSAHDEKVRREMRDLF